MEAQDLNPDPFALRIESQALGQKSLRGSFATVLSQISKFAVQFGSQIVLARLLFPADFGVIAMAYPIIGFIQIFNDLGLGQAIVQRPSLTHDQVSALFWVNLLAGSSLALLAFILGPITAWIYHEPRVTFVVLALAVTFPINALGIVPSSLLSRHMQFWTLARNEIVTMIVGAGVVIVSALGGLSYWSIVIGQIVGAILNVGLLWTSTRWRPSRAAFAKSTWSDLRFGGNLTLSNLATFAITSGDNFIVGVTSGKLALGLYDRSYGLVVQPLSQLTAPMSRTALPLLSRLSGEPDRYRTAYLALVRAIALATIPAMLICIVDGQEAVEFFLGSRWRDAVPVFRWISVGGLTGGIYGSASWLFISQGKAREMRRYTFTCAVINVLSYLIGSFWGVVGIAASAGVVFASITTPVMLRGATRTGPVTQKDLFLAVSPFFAQAAITSLVLINLRKLHLAPFYMLAIASVSSYCCFLLVGLVDLGQRTLLRDGFRNLGIFAIKSE